MEKQIQKSKRQIVSIIAVLLIIISVVKYIEFLFIRTEENTILADNVICKIFCIVATLVAMKICTLKISDIGLRKRNALKYIGCGFSLGLLTFAVSYGLEMILLSVQGENPHFSLCITNFTPTGATATVPISLTAVFICIFVNIINVLAEEGLFRGFILKTVSDKWGFSKANFVQALLFGLWHIVMCVKGVIDGDMTVLNAVVFGIGYVVLAGILAIEWGTCVNMTGVLWVGLSEHFFNNFIGNFLHVVSDTGTDELQIVRIVLSNILSLAIVLLINRNSSKQ